jgi:hypothetical protein
MVPCPDDAVALAPSPLPTMFTVTETMGASFGALTGADLDEVLPSLSV